MKIILFLAFTCMGFSALSAAPKKEQGPGATSNDSQLGLSDYDYEFGRALRPGEHNYQWYRTQHADEAAKQMGLDPKAVGDGMDTWHWWVGVDNPGFWRDLAKLTGGHHNKTNLRLDLLRVVMTVPRAERFKVLGVINDPDTVAAEKPDQFGLMIDRMKDGTLTWDPEKFGYSSGIIGLQLFKNEKFDSKNWSVAKYLEDPKSVEPPYKIGMSCAFCHIGFNPLSPPADTANPSWENLTSAIGNQYLREGNVFGQNLSPKSFIYQYINTQEPGTSETSRFPTDSINNPTVINSIFRLKERLKLAKEERITPAQRTLLESMYKNAGIPLDSPFGALGGTPDKPTIKVPHVLTDGSDSLGVLMASVRVYVNEGMMHKDWYKSWPINPFDLKSSFKRDFKPEEFDIMGTMRKDPNSPWMQTERRMPNMATFLSSYDSFALSEAGSAGQKHLSKDKELLQQGKLVFADNCARCHSSKVPSPMPSDPEAQKKAWREIVLKDDFLKDNYLSDDERHSVQELGTNAQRAEGTNAHGGSSWGQMSSQTYKDMRAVKMDLHDLDPEGKAIPLYNPLTGKRDIKWSGPTGYYRTPTLVSIWATAPFLHNNALGSYKPDPSIDARMESYKDAMSKMLWPERRLGIKSIKVTSEETSLPDLFPGLHKQLKVLDGLDLKLLMLPKGTPVNLLMSLNPKHLPALVEAYIEGVLGGEPRTKFKSFIDRRRDAGMKAMIDKMLELNSCPDFIEDRGHTYGSHLSDAEKNALIEYVKHF